MRPTAEVMIVATADGSNIGHLATSRAAAGIMHYDPPWCALLRQSVLAQLRLLNFHLELDDALRDDICVGAGPFQLGGGLCHCDAGLCAGLGALGAGQLGLGDF